MLVDKQSELMSDLLLTVHQHGRNDVTWKPPIVRGRLELGVWFIPRIVRQEGVLPSNFDDKKTRECKDWNIYLRAKSLLYKLTDFKTKTWLRTLIETIEIWTSKCMDNFENIFLLKLNESNWSSKTCSLEIFLVLIGCELICYALLAASSDARFSLAVQQSDLTCPITNSF